MATCNPTELLAEGKCFDCLDEGLKQTIKLQLLCEIANGSGATGITSLTGDVTATGPGAAAATIAARAVTFAKLQAISTSRVLGRLTAGSGDVEELTITGTGNAVFSASPTFTGQVQFADGSAAAPSIRFTDADTGFYQGAVDRIYMSCAGTAVGYFNSTSLRLVDGSAAAPSHGFTASSSSGMYHIGSGTLGFSVAGTRAASFSADSLALGSSGDTILVRAASDTLALRRGSNLQNLRVYGTYTDDANGEWLAIESGGTVFDIKTVANGTGTANALRLGVNGSTQWQINTSGHWISGADNTYDIGASGVNRPRNLFIAGGITHGSATLLTTTTALTNGAAAQTGTLTNAPSAGNPTKWIPINDNGTTRYIPAW